MKAWQTIAHVFQIAEADLRHEIAVLTETMLTHPPRNPHVALANLAVIDAREALASCVQQLALDALIEAVAATQQAPRDPA